MIYQVEFTKPFKKELSKLDKYTQILILNWIEKNIIGSSDPRVHGQALTGSLNGHWRYRIGDYRIISVIEDKKLIIYFLNVGHRRELYKK